MRTGVIIRSYRLTEFLERVLKNYAHVDKIVVANFPFGDYAEKLDNTKEIVDASGLKNITFLTGSEPMAQKEVFDLAQKELLDCDVVFISDADEFLLKSDQKRIAEDLIKGNHSKAECVVVDYQKLPYAFAHRSHTPVVAFKPPTVFSGTRYCYGDCKRYTDIFMHHFGYAIQDYAWKLSNLWYPERSADEIVCSKTRKMELPEELLEALNRPAL